MADCEYEVTFTDLSIANAASITSWNWSFGDGGTSTAQHPVYTYATFGTYNVTLIVTNSNGCIDSVTLPVVVPEMPIADFTADTACAGMPTQFTDLSISNSSPITGWDWDFGDGGTSTVQNPIYNYTTAGTYTVTLIVTTGAGCTDTVQHDVLVQPNPVADFTTTPVCDGDSMCFTDLSQHNATSITSWSWDFGDGQSSTAQNPCHLYTTFGIYNVILTVTNDLGCTDDTTIAVEVYPNPVADFSYVADCEYEVTFTDLSIANAASITSWNWSFGDGGTSTAQHPVYTYATFGTYNVTLIVTNSNGCVDSVTLPVVVPEMPIADFTADTACAGMPTQFTDLSISNSSTITGWDWDFGDGGSSNVQHPVYTYSTAGTYTVTLIVTAANNCTGSVQRNVLV